MKSFISFIVIVFLFSLNTAIFAAVPQLPSDNLLKNPWFRDSLNKPSLQDWVDATGPLGHWVASDKPGNPSPDNAVGTSARISVGEEGGLAATIPVNYPAYLYQVVPADPSKKTLKFDMYWVTHTVKPVTVTVYGSNSANGPWTQVWVPFNKTFTQAYVPPAGSGPANAYLWNYYSNMTDMVSTTISTGYPYYKLQVYAVLPDEAGGLKLTGMYFANGSAPIVPNPDPDPDPIPVPDPIRPGDTDPRPTTGGHSGSHNKRSGETLIRKVSQAIRTFVK